MSQFAFNRPARPGNVPVPPLLGLWISSKFIAKGVLFTLVGALGMPLVAQPLITPVVAQTQEVSQTNAIAQQLLGQWQAKDPTSGEEFTFIFAPEGKLFIVMPAPDGSSVALNVGYQINPSAQPMQLDIQLSPKEQALTIFELTSEGQLRLELEGLTPGQPRPTAFEGNAILFTKVSEETTVPEEIQVVELEPVDELNQQRDEKPEDEAKKYLYALTQVQRAHYSELGKFATTIEDVSIGLRTETELYRYRMVPQGDETQSVMIVAEAKNSELPSYTGAVFVTQVNGEMTTVAQICETNQPSTSPPAMPTPPATGSVDVQCPTGSRALQ